MAPSEPAISFTEVFAGEPVPAWALSDPASKVFILVRHGQGYHNLAAVGLPPPKLPWVCVCRTGGPGDPCPYSNPDHADAELTSCGVGEAASAGKELAKRAGDLAPDLVLVSPLTRTLQTCTTALEAAGDAVGAAVPVIAEEGLRERLGMHYCNKRSSVDAALKAKFPRVDFSNVAPGPDLLFNDDVWEEDLVIAERAKGLFLRLRSRPEKCIACFAHFAILNAALKYAFTTQDPRGR
jgi:broad specificity phosphatase PhoE